MPELVCISPIDGKPFVTRPYAEATALRQRIADARRAQADWARRPLDRRIEMVEAGIARLEAMNPAIVPELARQMGRPVRFGGEMGGEFVSDFLSVAADEAMHFALIDRKLDSLGSFYGALPAHDGLWSAAQDTAHDVAARLAIVPMVLEARGLDVTPATLDRVARQGDEIGAKILKRILDDEIRHVAIGTKHFRRICAVRGLKPLDSWQNLVKKHFAGALKPPFNDSARSAAGLSRDFYAGIA